MTDLLTFAKTLEDTVIGYEVVRPLKARLLLEGGKKLNIDLIGITATQRNTLKTIGSKLIRLGIIQKLDPAFSAAEGDITAQIDAEVAAEIAEAEAAEAKEIAPEPEPEPEG